MQFNAIEYINSFSHTGKKVTDLSRISGLLKRLDNPQNGQKFVHIAGTNGKGSTLEYMSQALIKAGYKKTSALNMSQTISFCIFNNMPIVVNENADVN